MSWLRRIRIAWRSLRWRPLFTVTTVVCLALGIGATTAIFSVVNALLLQPTPVADLEKVLFFMALRHGVEPYSLSPIEVQAFTERTRSFRSLGLAVTGGNANFAGGDRPERVRAAHISRSYLATLAISPSFGRNFNLEEDRDGGPSAVLVSQGLWTRRFGADPAVVGSTVRLDSKPYTIVGILPPGFDLPAKTDLWFPLRFDFGRIAVSDRSMHSYMMVGRLLPEASRETAEADVVRIARELQQETPATNAGWSATLIPLRSLLLGDIQGRIRTMLYALAVAVSLLLVIACINAGHLFLARFVERERQIAVAAALGAGRSVIALQLLTESLILALAAGMLGALFVFTSVPAIMSSSPVHEEAYTNFFRAVPIDSTVLFFTFAVSVSTAIAFGSLPLIRLSRSDLNRSLRSGAGSDERRRGTAWLWGLVVAEIAISMTLLVGAGLLVQSFRRLSRVEVGFQPTGLVGIDFTLPALEFPDRSSRVAFSRQVLERVRNLTGVISAGVTSDVPLRWGTWDMNYEVEGIPLDGLSQESMTAHRIVTPGYLETIEVALLSGRTFTPADRADSDRVVIVSEELARRAWPGAEPLGKRVRISSPEGNEPWMTVVGVVADVKEDRYNFRVARPVWYLPFEQVEGQDPSTLYLVMRIEGDAYRIASDVRRSVAALYSEIAPGEIADLSAEVRAVTATERLGTFVATTLATLGTALASIGLYGAMAYSVRQRLRELGVRLALGASPRALHRFVLWQGMRITLLGVALGLGGALALGRLLSGILFDMSPYDPATLVGVTVTLVLVAGAACLLPARRASRTDPVSILRAE